MSTSTPGLAGVDLPADRLATAGDLDALHTALRQQGVHPREGGWVIARPEEVDQALVCPALRVSATQLDDDAPAGGARGLQAAMARSSDGGQHARRRAALDQLLPAVGGLQDAAAARTTAALHGRAGVVDVMALASSVPVTVLASALEVPPDQVGAVADLVAQVCRVLAPRLGPPADPREGDAGADELVAVLTTAGPWDGEQVAAVAGLLFQARDATAALIGSTLLADRSRTGSGIETGIDATLRRQAPVQCTRRTATDDVRLGAAVIPRGAPVWLVLAAAEQGPPARPATFGAGPHACPGASHAIALARGVLSALDQGGWQPVPGQPVGYEPRPNLRLPATVLVQRS